MLQLHNYRLSNYGITNKKGRAVPLTLALDMEYGLELTGSVHASGDTTASSRVHGHQVLGLQISKTRNAAQIGFDAAIRTTGRDRSVKIGSAALHSHEAALLRTTQIANVVGDGWSSFGTLGARHVTDHFICMC